MVQEKKPVFRTRFVGFIGYCCTCLSFIVLSFVARSDLLTEEYLGGFEKGWFFSRCMQMSDAQVNPIDINSAEFDCEAYLSDLLKKKSLDELVAVEETMVHNVSSYFLCFQLFVKFYYTRIHWKLPHSQIWITAGDFPKSVLCWMLADLFSGNPFHRICKQ